MSAYSQAVTEQIRAAMQSSNPRDIVAGVKDAVAHELGSLSPDAKIVVTEYFNHSYMPDLVLEWKEAGKADERPIFLRNSFRPDVVNFEVEALAKRGPVVLSLTQLDGPAPRFDLLREQARQTNRVLVTDVASLANVAVPTGNGEHSNRPATSAPLLRLVQVNLLKGGRGLLTSEDAERLTRSATPADDRNDLTEEFLSSFQESTDELFAPDAALRLRRAAELLRFGVSNEIVQTLSLAEGQLSDDELRVLIPYLLADDRAIANSRLWTHLGSMMSLERLEDMGDILGERDVSPLVIPNLEAWTARRAQLVINASHEGVDAESADDDPGYYLPAVDSHNVPSIEARPFWYVRNRMLAAETGPWRLFVTTDARRLKGRTDSAAALWDDISPLLAGFSLEAIDLRGLSRRISVGVEGTGDVSADVARIRASIEDTFKVGEIRVRRIGDDEDAARLDIDFAEMTVTAGRATIAALVAAVAVLGHRAPPDLLALSESDH
jgi:hypothetical protein